MTPQDQEYGVICRVACEDIARLIENHPHQASMSANLIGMIRGVLKERMGEYNYWRASGKFTCQFGSNDITCGCGECSALSAMLEELQ